MAPFLEIMSAVILPTHTPELLAAAVEAAAVLLRSGEVVAVPTETVYGLAANAYSDSAVAKIFEIKGRPPNNPVIVHVASLRMAKECAAEWNPMAEALAEAFWPGPLTLVVPRSPMITDRVTAGGDTVGLRWPQHPFMQRLIRLCEFPIAAPSANLANRLSPTCARHVTGQLGDKVPLIVDGGDCNVGIESTVVDVTGNHPIILRPGVIDRDAVNAVWARCQLRSDASRAPVAGTGVGVGRTDQLGGTDSFSSTGSEEPIVLRSPGMLTRHYAPKAIVSVVDWRDEADLKEQLKTMHGSMWHPETTWIVARSRIPMSGYFSHVMLVPDDPEAFARALYQQLHLADEAGAERIVVEAVPDTAVWAGVADRLRRAAAPH